MSHVGVELQGIEKSTYILIVSEGIKTTEICRTVWVLRVQAEMPITLRFNWSKRSSLLVPWDLQAMARASRSLNSFILIFLQTKQFMKRPLGWHCSQPSARARGSNMAAMRVAMYWRSGVFLRQFRGKKCTIPSVTTGIRVCGYDCVPRRNWIVD